MTRLYFVRHGKTTWNLEGRYQGANGDSPLLPESYAQIAQLAGALRGIPFAHAYVSPLPRARNTATALIEALGQRIPTTVTAGMREFNLGKMEGMRFADVAKRYPKELHAFREAPGEYDPTAIHGETFPQLIARMQPVVLDAVAQDTTGQANLLFVSHGAALVALIQSLLGTPIAAMRKDGGLTNTSVTILAAHGPQLPFELIRWNDTHFLTRRLEPTDTI
ncbi:histidine phosphatase family protein [Lacticaseibacillus absianus]|uniref:histidine phosphatase family protein n=1 Tax=Lacticaseibacillus absianus TaxID=2729623 RepID=UPI0015CE402C